MYSNTDFFLKKEGSPYVVLQQLEKCKRHILCLPNNHNFQKNMKKNTNMEGNK